MADDGEGRIRDKAKETAEIIQDAFRSIAASIPEMFADALDTAEDGVASFAKTAQKDVTKAVNQMAKYSDLLIKNEVKLSQGQLKSKDVRKQILELKAKEMGTVRALNVAARQGFITEKDKKKKIAEVLSITKEVTQELEEQEKLAKGMEFKSKFFESMAKTIGSIPVLGKMLAGPFTKGAEAAKEAAGQGKNFFQAQAAGAGAVVGELFSITKIIGLMIAGFFEVDNNITSLGKNLNLSRDAADKMESGMRKYANATGDSAIDMASMVKSQEALEKSSGIHMKRSNETLGTMSKLTNDYGISATAAARLEKLSKVTGKNFSTQYKATIQVGTQLARNNGLNFSQKSILEDVVKVTGALAAQLGNNPVKIAKAVVQAKLLGTTLQGVANIGKSLVDFEKSIGAELEAELLTGKDLNLERARALSLAGDQEGLAAELVSQVGTLSEFQDMNVIQQQMLAQAFGMSSDQMADMLEQQEYQNEMKEELPSIEEKSLEQMGAQVSLMKELMRMVTKLKDKFMEMYRGPLGKIAIRFKDFISDAGNLKKIFWGIGIIMTANILKSMGGMVVSMGRILIKAGLWLGEQIAIGIASITTASALTVGIGLVAITAGIAAGAAAMYALMDDGASFPAGYGSRVLSSPEGTFALNNKDTVVAGTNLFQKADDVELSGEGELSVSPKPMVIEKDESNNQKGPIIIEKDTPDNQTGPNLDSFVDKMVAGMQNNLNFSMDADLRNLGTVSAAEAELYGGVGNTIA